MPRAPARPEAGRAPAAAHPTPSHDCRALYVHIPFCETKCAYCDFYSLPGGRRGREPGEYLDALDRELAARAPAGFAPETVFVGGGTPTVLSPDEIRRLGEILRARCDLSRVREWTVEANPGTLDAARIDALLASGVDRVSVGVQSFDDRVLKSVGRIHDAAQARAAVRDLRAAGVPRVSVDLLFAVPGQGRDGLARDLDEALALGTGHLSCYALLWEEGTTMLAREKRGLVGREPEDLEREMLLGARTRIREAGFRAYEISNFARPGQECLHNLVYWRNGAYLGVGVSAASYLDGVRSSNVRDLRAYLDRVAATGGAAAESERLDGRGILGETVMLGLRLDEGVRWDDLSARSGLDARAAVGPLAERFARAGLLQADDDGFRLTEEGVPVSDAVIAEFLST
ncbi:MAG TPA: radical SAM family heme chaperone HemW [Planctomycetota bacterium]|nr:radical SAM family heme chaperone HemW [Planctomycetota bacterium]